MKLRSFSILLGLSFGLPVPRPAAAAEILNGGPDLTVVKGDIARVSAQFFDADGNGTLTLRALNADGQPVGEINRNDASGDLEWLYDTSAQAPGLSTIRLMAEDDAGASTKVSFSLQVRTATVRERWRQLFFGASGNAGSGADDADPERDGRSNLLEFAFGTDPRKGEALPVYAMAGGQAGGASVANQGGMKAVFQRRKDHVVAGLVYVVEFSTNLKTWAATTQAPAVVADEGDMERVQVDFPVLASGETRQFFRIRVEESAQQ